MVREEQARVTNLPVHIKLQNRSCFADDSSALSPQEMNKSPGTQNTFVFYSLSYIHTHTHTHTLASINPIIILITLSSVIGTLSEYFKFTNFRYTIYQASVARILCSMLLLLHCMVKRTVMQSCEKAVVTVFSHDCIMSLLSFTFQHCMLL